MNAPAFAPPSRSEVERAFQAAMSDAGFLTNSIEPDTPNFVRFDAPGDKAGKRNGFYKLKVGRYSVGWFGDWKTGEQHQWFYDDGRTLTEDERKSIKREQARLKAEAAQARELRQAEVAEDASAMWGKADANVEGHPYLERKRVNVARGLRIHTAKDGARLLAVPMWSFDMNGQPKLTSLQMIAGDGSKRFLKAGRVEGTWFSLKGDTSLIVLCEGVATAFSIWEATGYSVVAAFNSGNLIEVSKEFARWRPMATLLIAADNDEIAPADWEQRGQGKPWVNQGRKKAEAAAKAIGCRWVYPAFADGPGRDRTDFNDLHIREGLDRVGAQIVGCFRSVEAEDAAPGAKIVDIRDVQDESWRARVPVTSQGNPDGANVEGVAIYIAHHRLLAGRLRFNAFTKMMEVDGNEVEDCHTAEFRRIMHADRFKARKPDVLDEMEAEARRNTFDPLHDYLTGVKHDGRKRLETWMPRYLGTVDDPYTREVGRCFLVGAVARARQPGCKMDTMPVLEGDQGIGKSTALRYLFGDRFFTDELPDFHSKDAFMQLSGSWCIEVAELSAYSKADVKDVKKFLSRLEDKFRPPYGRHTIRVLRRTVFAGSVNPEDGNGYLRDQTGARRFWPVMCGVVDLGGILKDRDQLWAEAVQLYEAGEKWHMVDEDVLQLAKAEQEARREVDPWEEPIGRFLWNRVDVTIADVISECLKLTPDRVDSRTPRRVGSCLRALRWWSKPVRPGPGEKPVKTFYPPEGHAARAWRDDDDD